MKKIFTLLLCSALFAGSCWGTEVTIGSGDNTTTVSPLVAGEKWSICQQLYTKKQLNDAGLSTTEGITAIAFNYASTSCGGTQNIEVYFTLDSYSSFGDYHDPVAASDLVFSGNITLPDAPGWYKITLDTKTFKWNGTSNALLVTVLNKSTSKKSGMSHYCFSSSGRQNYSKPIFSPTAPIGSSVTATKSGNVPQIKFYFGSDTPTYDKPANVSVTAKTSSTATIGWSKKDSAVIKLEYKLSTAESWTLAKGDIAENSYTISGLTASTGYKYQVTAVYPTGSSEAVSGTFTTEAASDHIHDGVEFQEWTSTTTLPDNAGSYYLKNGVSVSSWTVPTGDTKICLNGKTITFSSGYITIGSEKNLSIFDCKGTGAITANQTFYSTIKVNGGTLSLYGGAINNTASSSSSAYAIDVTSGTFNIKGDVKMSTGSSAANVYLRNTASVITLAGAITNTTKLSVNKAANSNITSGWSTQMGSADPADFFSSKNSDAPSVILVSGEAQLGVPSITINETGSNSIENNKLTDVNLVRTFKKGILNTIALPFALSDAKLQAAFGEDYELYKLSSSSLSSGVLELYFEQITALEGGKPYLLRINGDDDITNPSFSSVTLTTAHPRISTTAVDMIPVISESEITGASYNMYLNAAGELNWSTTTSSFKGMRAYFQVKGEMPSNVSVRRIVLGTDATTGLMQNAECTMQNGKMMVNGQLFIIKNGVKYNALGQIVK